MKFVFFVLTVFSSIVAAHADLVMQHQSIFLGETNTITTKIHGAKIRDDGGGRDISIIRDASTGDMTMLMHQSKTFTKYSGARAKELIESGGTNAAPKLVDTGKSENVAGYDAEIYRWSDADGMILTFWVANDFPNFEHFRADLAKYDRATSAGMGKGTAPELSKLPGMVVKSQMVFQKLTHTRTLISAKEEPVNSSIFEIPKGYKETDPDEASPATNLPSAPSK